MSAPLQLHLSDQQIYCLRCDFYQRFDGTLFNSQWPSDFRCHLRSSAALVQLMAWFRSWFGKWHLSSMMCSGVNLRIIWEDQWVWWLQIKNCCHIFQEPEWVNFRDMMHICFVTWMWVRSRNCGCLVTWFFYQLIAKPGNKTATVPWPDPYEGHW